MQLKYHLFIPEIVRGFPKQELACQFSAQRGSSEVAQLLANGRIIIMLATPTYFFWHLRAFLLKRRCACWRLNDCSAELNVTFKLKFIATLPDVLMSLVQCDDYRCSIKLHRLNLTGNTVTVSTSRTRGGLSWRSQKKRQMSNAEHCRIIPQCCQTALGTSANVWIDFARSETRTNADDRYDWQHYCSHYLYIQWHQWAKCLPLLDWQLYLVHQI